MTTPALLRAVLVAALAAVAACGDETPEVAAPRPVPAAEEPGAAAAQRRRAAEAGPASEPETPGDAAGRRRLRFHVVDAVAHAPVAGAVLAVLGEEAVPEAHSDAAGAARLDVEWKFSGTRVSVRAQGYARRIVRIEAEADVSKPVEVELAPGVTATGTVLGTDGCAIAGATVAAWWEPGEHTIACQRDPDASPSLVAVSDAAGRFAIDGVPRDAGGVFMISAEAPGRVRTTVPWTPRGPPAEIRMPPAVSVTGTVRAPDGRPVEGAEVQLWVPVKADESMHVNVPRARAETDADGRYRIDGLTAGHRWSVLATHGVFADSEQVDDLAVDSDATCDLTLRLVARLDVTVLGPDGGAADRAWLEVESGGRSQHAASQVPPSFDVVIRSPGPCRLTVNSLSLAPKTVELTVAPGEHRALEVRLDAGVTIAGLVVDDAGQRVAGARLSVRPSRANRGAPAFLFRDTVSGPDGSFRMGGLVEGTYLVVGGCEAYEPGSIESVSAPTADARVVLRRVAQLAATFRTKEGSALPDRWWARGTRPASWSRDRSVADLAAWMGKTAEISPGPWSLTIAVDGYVPVQRDVDLAPGETRTLENIELDPGVELGGRVVDESGHGVKGAYVAAGGRGVKTGDDGSFTLEHVPRGDLDVVVTNEEFLDARVQRAASAPDEFVVTLRAGALLLGSVTDAAGAPVTLARLQFIPTARPNQSVTTLDLCDDAGQFEIRLPPGEYTVLATFSGGSARAKATVIERGEATVELIAGK